MRTSRSLNKFFSIGKGLTIVSLALLVVCWAAGSIWAGEKQVSNKSAAKTAVPAQLTAPVMLSGDVQPDVKSLTPREEAEQLLALIRDAKDAGQQPDPAWLSRLDELTYNPTADRNPLDQGGEDWANATNILSVPYTDSGNLGALDDCVGRPFNDVFYVYNVATTGSHTIDMCTSADDTYLKIWRNPTGACTGGTTFTSDDVCGVAPSVAVSLTAGDVIYIECGRYSAGAQSAYALHVGAPARPCADCAPADGNLDPVNTAVYAQFISGDCGNGGKWSGSFTAIAGHTYHFDLCSTPPGSGTNAGFDVGPGGGDVDLKIVSSSCSIITGVDGLFNCVPAYSPNDFTWTATASGTFYVIIAPYNSSNTHTCQGDATETFTLNYYRDEPAPAPPGDVCATALPLNVPGSVSGSTLTFNNDYDYACFYTGSTSRDVVYTYTPVQTELVSLSLCGGTTNYDTKLYVYAGSCVNPPLYCNDDMCNNDPLFSPNFVSRLECVQLTGGTTYYVVVDGYGGYNGDYTLEASICVPPVNDECVDAIDLTVNGSQYCGTTSSSSDDCALVSYAEVWHTFTLTECMDVSIEYCGTTASGSLLLSIFNQGCCAAPAINPDSYEYDTCLDGLITAHYGSLPAGNYWVPVGFSNQGSYCIRVAGTACTPGVDCALPITIASLPYSDAASTVGRGNNHNPLCALETHTAPDVAYHYAPADDEWVTVSLCGSAYDSKLAIYDASNTVPGAELYCSDDYCGLQSQIDCASLLAGVTYCIVVDGWDAASGNYTLNVTNCDAPVTVYVDDDWTSQNDVDLFDDQLIWQYDAYNNIPDGIDAVVGSTVYVLPGTYPTGITHITSTMDLVGYDLL